MSLEPREAQKIEDALKGKDLDRLVDLVVRFESVYIETLREIANLKENEEYYTKELSKLESSSSKFEIAEYERSIIEDYQKSIVETLRRLDKLEKSIDIYEVAISQLQQREHLDELHKEAEKERPKVAFIKVLGIIQDSDSIERLFNLVAFSNIAEICDNAANALMRSRFPSIYKDQEEDDEIESGAWIERNFDWDKIKVYYKIARGKNLQGLKRIASKVREEAFRSWVIENAMDHTCGLKVIGDCDQYISPQHTYFIAYPFSNSIIRTVIEDAFEERWSSLFGAKHCKKYKAIVAGQTIDNGQILCDICKKVLYSQFGVFVLSKEVGSNLSNPNVMLELGIAMKFGKPCILIIENGTKYPADLQGRLYIPYVDHDQLKKGIIEKRGLERELGVEIP